MNRPRKPALTDRVLRGLNVLASNGYAAQYHDGTCDREEALAAGLTAAELSDARTAIRWIASTTEHRKLSREDAPGRPRTAPDAPSDPENDRRL